MLFLYLCGRSECDGWGSPLSGFHLDWSMGGLWLFVILFAPIILI